MTLPDLAGHEIAEISVSRIINVYTETMWTITLEGSVHLATTEGVRPVPMDSDTWYTPDYLEFASGRITHSVLVSDNGDLAVLFDGGQISVTNDCYEPWSIYGPRGETVWGGKAGEWVVFDARGPEPE